MSIFSIDLENSCDGPQFEQGCMDSYGPVIICIVSDGRPWNKMVFQNI